MDVKEIIPEDRLVILEHAFDDKIQLIEHLFDRCIEDTPLTEHRHSIWNTLLEREQSMSTGIGVGVAIPHCSSEYVPDVVGIAGILKNGVDFQAVDEVPVRIVVLLLMPKKKFEKHIKVLAAIAKLFNNESVRENILKATSPAEAFQVIVDDSSES
ncbi:MAG: PTS sugar transporter subunit IIA [Leptospirales bacterium]|jgi:mannitol/fructose-specific phosphotransferase system IIA component (Ntr-type)